MRPLALCLLFLAMPALAADKIIDLDNLPDGTYILKKVGNSIDFKTVTVIQPDGTPDVDPPTPPVPTELTERAQEYKDAALLVQGDDNREATAGQLAELYRVLAQKIRDGEITGQAHISLAIKHGTDLLLTSKNLSDNWAPIRDLLSAHRTAILQLGGSDGDYAKLLGDVADGLNASAPNAQLDIAMIMMIIKLVMELLAMFKG